MIEMRRVTFSYADRRVLDGCSALFKPGEFCAIIGPNGSGKSTLLRLLSRLLTPQQGQILLENQEVSGFGRKEFSRKVALMPQTRTIPEMTVREYLEHGRYPYLPFSQTLSQADRMAVLRALQKTDMLGFENRTLHELSGGERQRAYLALLLTQDTEYVLLDEPTTYLDISAQFRVMQILRAMRDEGRCVVAVLHDIGLALQFSDRVIVMQEGRICADAAPCVLANTDIWKRVFSISCSRVHTESGINYVFEPAT